MCHAGLLKATLVIDGASKHVVPGSPRAVTATALSPPCRSVPARRACLPSYCNGEGSEASVLGEALGRRPRERKVRGRISRGLPVREAGVARVWLIWLPLVLAKDVNLLEAPGTQVAPGFARQVASQAVDLSAYRCACEAEV